MGELRAGGMLVPAPLPGTEPRPWPPSLALVCSSDGQGPRPHNPISRKQPLTHTAQPPYAPTPTITTANITHVCLPAVLDSVSSAVSGMELEELFLNRVRWL